MKKISLTLAMLAAAAGAFAQSQPQPASMPAASAPSAEQRAARHEARVEQRIKYLHDQLKITSAQEPQWKTFADTMRENGDTMGRLYRERMESRDVSAVDDMKQYAALAQANADGAKSSPTPSRRSTSRSRPTRRRWPTPRSAVGCTTAARIAARARPRPGKARQPPRRPPARPRSLDTHRHRAARARLSGRAPAAAAGTGASHGAPNSG
jgi:hypothetical protein